MQYTVNLYKADAQGFLVARACLKKALQVGATNTRDSRLLLPEMPQWNYSPLYAPVPIDEFLYTKLRAADLKRTFPDFKDPATVKTINESKLDLQTIRGLLATDEKSYGGLFLQYLMSYPRWSNSKGEIEVGGTDYFDILEEAADAERKATNAGLPARESDTSQIATITQRTHKRMEALANVSPDKMHVAFAEMERQKRGGIDEAVSQFRDFVNMLGAKTGCNSAAGAVINATDQLLALLGSCGINDFQTLDAACNNAEDALSDLGLALAVKQDATQTPIKAELIGEQAEQLAAAMNSAIAAARNKKDIKTKHVGGKNGRKLTKTEIERNRELNDLVAEIRRRAKNKYTLGKDGITNAYNEIENESQQAGSKWQKIIGMKSRKTIIDKALHNKKYVVRQNGKRRGNLSGE